VCCLNDGSRDPCGACLTPDSGGYCQSGIAGSYRRR
jgi:hypothetical protein